MQTLRKKTSPCKYRNDPGRFFGDGVTFKAKLIGILEVGEARGDRMCQEALQDLKMAIRAAGEHKQRITIHVTIEGLRLRDEKTGDSLYHHPVHKISFIAQDMTDSRAFGYIFGSPDSGHRFFGIKTDKAASQVVLAMRDLFQVVFELKKKEIEMARQQIQSKTIHEHQPLSLNIKGTSNEASNLTSLGKSINELSRTNAKEISPESVADLVDLEQELSSIQRGITQMERITPSEPTPSTKIPPEEDPFGDSFTNFPTYNLLPPPESSRSRHSKPSSAASAVASTTKISDSVNGQITTAFKNLPSHSTNTTPTVTSITSKPSDNWLGHNNVITHFESSKTLTKQQPSLDINSVTSTTSATATTSTSTSTSSTVVATTNSSSQQQQLEDIVAQKTGEDSSTSKSFQNANNQIQYIDAFTDLDPLGTGKIKPYVDKKYFFHELKNPPKKVLKELSGQESCFPATFSGNEVNDTSSSPITITLTDPLIEKPLTEQNKLSSEILAVTTEEKINSYSSSSTYSQTGYFSNQIKTTHTDKPLNIDLERTKLEEPVMIPRDTDPFSPTRKKSDPFQDGDIFSKLDPFEFEFINKSSGPTTSDTRTITTSSTIKKETTNIFNGPLQVNLPPESGWNTMNATTSPGQRKIERQTSESPTSISRNRPSVFKQNTVDVISSISSKKMPHLFGQKFSKRDSNSINMRRLQESDSLSENETAPEPPPRPDTTSHIEPPPLPPKKQFSDIVIRPRITSSSAVPPLTRYEYISSKIKSSSSSSTSNQQCSDSSAPPIPLPSRKVGRIDSSFPGPGRPARKPGSGAVTGEEDDYLTPITMSRNDVPPLLPPPETKGRGRRSNYAEVKPESENAPPASGTTLLMEQQQTEGILPDITLTQLLTLGIDELAMKLNVPTTKLSTMTLVELTSYLSEFIETRKNNQQPKHTVAEEIVAAPVFKVNFDQNSEATFVAKFDDNFGEEPSTATTFVANFSNLDMKPEKQAIPSQHAPTVPSADRYAVFREIIDQEIQEKSTTERNDSSEFEEDLSTGGGDGIPIRDVVLADSENETAELSGENITPMQVPKIDTKITEAISHAKDRYAALRDIILVEDLFEKPVRPIENLSTVPGWEDEQSIVGKVTENTFEESLTNDFEDEEVTCPQIQETKLSEDEEEKDDTIISTKDIKQNGKTGTTMQTLSVTNNKDDIEIDELMNRAISNLSLDSREHLSPNQFSKSPNAGDNATINSATSPNAFNKQRTSPSNQAVATIKTQFSDVSTSPVHQLQHQQKSPVPAQKSPLSKSPIIKSPASKSPVPQSAAVTNLIDNTKRANSGSLSDMICGSSPEANLTVPESSITKLPTTTSTPPINADESWAVFDKPNIIENNKKEQSRISKAGTGTKDGESPCSSDGKDDWKAEQEYSKKWPRGHTSSSSRDLSPWDDETADYKKRIPAGADRHGYYMRHARRMNSCDDDYEYEDDMVKRRDKRIKPPMSRSRENFDSDSQNWYQSGGSGRHNWSPEDDERLRQFDRSSYERSTYGPPYDKRHPAYDRREYSKSYDKRKYYREYSRPPPPPDYEFESTYGESPDIKDNRKIMYYGDGMVFEKPKSRRDYENIYEGEFIRDGVGGSVGGRTHKSSSRGEYFYERDRKSFDRDSVESYESTGRRHKSFGSGDVYGSLDSREDFRERYVQGGEKSRSLRKGMKIRVQAGNEEYEQDSENEIQIRRPPGDTRSLQRPPQGTRIRKSSGSSPWDGEEIPPIPSQKGWKRPSSASESDRRLAENRRVLCHTLSGSDGEKDRRFRKKSRPRAGKEIDGSGGIGGSMRQANVPMTRYRDRDGNYDYIDYEEDDYEEQPVDEDKFERLNRRRYEMHQRMIEIERRKRGDKYAYERPENIIKYSSNNKDLMFTPENDQYNIQKFDAFETPPPPKSAKSLRREFDFEDLDETPRSNVSSSSKFNFDEHGGGFESDFNSPCQTTGGGSSGGGGGGVSGSAVPMKSSFRFSNDFSDNKDKIQTVVFINDQQQQQQQQQQNHHQQQQQQQEFIMNNQTPTQKLRFDDKVTISKFENEQPTATTTGAFEDDFSQAQFVFDNDDQWNSTTTVTTEPSKILTNITVKNHLRLTKRQDHIKKSESVNIFARKNEDPFEDDDFFKSTTSSPIQQQHQNHQQKYDNSKISTNRKNNGNNETSSSFQWDNNFAKFDENM